MIQSTKLHCKRYCEFGKDWELYDMETDRTELNNLIGANQPLQRELIAQYEDWAEVTGVIDWARLEPILLKAWNMESAEG